MKRIFGKVVEDFSLRTQNSKKPIGDAKSLKESIEWRAAKTDSRSDEHPLDGLSKKIYRDMQVSAVSKRLDESSNDSEKIDYEEEVDGFNHANTLQDESFRPKLILSGEFLFAVIRAGQVNIVQNNVLLRKKMLRLGF